MPLIHDPLVNGRHFPIGISLHPLNELIITIIIMVHLRPVQFSRVLGWIELLMIEM